MKINTKFFSHPEILKISMPIGPIINSIDNRNSDGKDNTDAVVVSDSLLISDRAYTCLSLKAHNDNVFLKNFVKWPKMSRRSSL